MSKDLAKHNIKVKKEGGEALITGSIPVDVLETYRSQALDYFRNNIDLDGFRKGNVPDDVLIKNVPEAALYEEMASLALNELYPTIAETEKLQVIGRPTVQLTKLVPEQDVEFEIKTALMPDISLPDYKKIAQEQKQETDESIEVSDEEVERSVLEVRKVLAQRRAEADKKEKGEDEEAEEESAEKTEEKPARADNNSEEQEGEQEPPELTDADVAEIGPYKTVDEFKESVRKDLTRYKEEREEEKKRIELADALVEKSDITLPNLLIESEIRAMEAQFEDNLKRSGLKAEDYLKHVQKTREELQEEWRPEAEKRAKLQLILNKIASEEKLSPDEEEVKKEVDNILSHDSTIPRERATVYVETTLQNKAVFDFLENQKKNK